MPQIDNTSHTNLEQSVRDIDFAAYITNHKKTSGDYTKSPAEWEDEVLYFLMLDRFSDNNEKGYLDNNGKPVKNGSTMLFDFSKDAYSADRSTWFNNGANWCGGTLKGLQSKLGYIKRLGITAIWISPIFKQVTKRYDEWAKTYQDATTYHGYATQNFLDVDPHFGTRQDLRDLVREAHKLGIYVILDIVLNHSGDVFQYAADRYSFGSDNKPLFDKYGAPLMDPRWDSGKYPLDPQAAFRDETGKAAFPLAPLVPDYPSAWPNGALWPIELQTMDGLTREGHICNWDNEPEYLGGDFQDLKDIHHGDHNFDANGNKILDQFNPTPALKALCDVYKFWIAFADIDGFRIDTVKHMEVGATRYFSSVIREFAEGLGKENYLLIGEIAGGRDFAYTRLELTGLDAALGINDEAINMEYMVKGYRNAEDYFDLFKNSMLINKGSHTWFGKHVVTSFDDHDRIVRNKVRFCGDKANRGYEFLIPVVALNLLSMGIPCLYYGDEQGFDGNDAAGGNDRVLRECMFGGIFGSLQSMNRHFFNENHPAYKTIADIIALRKQYLILSRGRQYLRQISGTGNEGEFGFPQMIGGQLRSIVAWSRIFNGQEILCAINTDPDNAKTAWITVDAELHQNNVPLTCIYSTDKTRIGTKFPLTQRNGKSVNMTIEKVGFAAFM